MAKLCRKHRRNSKTSKILSTLTWLAIFYCCCCCFVQDTDASPFRPMVAMRPHEDISVRQRRAVDSCTKEPAMRRQGLVTRKQMPDSCKSFVETLRGPDGKRLRVKLDHAILNGEKNFVQINDGQATWYIDRSCAPCHEEHIQGNAITIEYRLTNSSRIQFRYTTNDNTCPFLTVMPPLKVRSKSQNMRDVGAVSPCLIIILG